MSEVEITYSQAICRAIKEEMEKDPTIFTYGEDIAEQGGIFGQYKDLIGEFDDRVIDTPISEEVIYGSAVGAALAGARPIVEFHFADFLFTGMTAVTNQIMKIRYMSGGQKDLPIILRGPDGRSQSAAAQHSQSIETIFMHVPGIKVVVPSTPMDVYGLYKEALNQNDPVIFFEHKQLYGMKGEVSEDEYQIPFGQASIKKEGDDITVVTTGRMVHETMKAARELEEEGISLEVIDMRTLVPWDKETVLESLKKTGRLMTVHETWRRAGWGAEVVAHIQEVGFDYLDEPLRRVGAKNVPNSFSPKQENFIMPDSNDVVRVAREFNIY